MKLIIAVLVIGLLGLGTLAGFYVRDIWRSLKSFMRAVRGFSEAWGIFGQVSFETESYTNVLENPERRKEARAERRRIREERRAIRRRKLDASAARWDEITEETFSGINEEAKLAAQEHLERSRQ
ncbi:MAG: hypothetical protein GX483_03445 [Actinomycetaceae bacterium]|nr:hypothetical protein [Actinomycetaceae bacterium]